MRYFRCATDLQGPVVLLLFLEVPFLFLVVRFLFLVVPFLFLEAVFPFREVLVSGHQPFSRPFLTPL